MAPVLSSYLRAEEKVERLMCTPMPVTGDAVPLEPSGRLRQQLASLIGPGGPRPWTQPG